MKIYFIILLWIIFPYHTFSALPPSYQVPNDIRDIINIVSQEDDYIFFDDFQIIHTKYGPYEFKYKIVSKIYRRLC